MRVGSERDGTVARDELAEAREGSPFDVHSGRGEHDVVDVARDRIGDFAVEGAALVVEAPELVVVARERTVAVDHALPAFVHPDVEPHGDRALGEELAGRGGGDRAAAERDDRGDVA